MLKPAPISIPCLNILSNGAPLEIASMDAKADLIRVSVSEDINAPGMFTLQLINRDLKTGKMTWVDDNLFDIGNSIEIQMGYKDNPKTLIIGDITGLEPEFRMDEVSTLTVRGYDIRHRLMRGQKTRSFTQMTDSAIASQVAQDAGLMIETKNTQISLEYVLQHNQTDLEFLQERAKRIGYEVTVEQKTLLFRPHQHQSQKVGTLTHGDNLLEFSPRLSTLNQVDKVEVRAWNVKEKKPLVGRFMAEDQLPAMGGSKTGSKVARQEFGQKSQLIVTESALSAAEARQMAQGQFNIMSLDYITGDGQSRGTADLRAGCVIEIAGVGRRFSGLYYVVSATHTYAKAEGYRTEFTVRRNAT